MFLLIKDSYKTLVAGIKLKDIFEKGLELHDIGPCATYEFISEDDLVSAIHELSKLYIYQREQLGRKELTPRLATAYLYLYFTSNIPKLFKLLNYLPKVLIEKIAAQPWMDFGAGPGTYTLAWYAWLSAQKLPFPKQSLLIEQDKAMMSIANKVLDQFLHHEEILVTNNIDQKKLEDATLFFGHSCNEVSLDELLRLIKDAAPRFLIFLEPGTPEVFKKMLDIRSHLLNRGYQIHYPCLQQKPCPMKNQDNWCHQYVHLRFTNSVDRLTQLTNLRRQHSAVIFHVYEKIENKIITNNLSHYRIIQGPEQNKGAWTWQVCNENGDLVWFESLTRQYNKEQLKFLELKVPGEIFSEVEIQKELKPHHYRVLVS